METQWTVLNTFFLPLVDRPLFSRGLLSITVVHTLGFLKRQSFIFCLSLTLDPILSTVSTQGPPPPPPLTILTHENKRHQLNVSAKVPSEVHISEWCKIWQYILLCGLCVYLPVYQAKSAELKSSNDRLWETQKQKQKMDTNTCTHTKIVLYQIILVWPFCNVLWGSIKEWTRLDQFRSNSLCY